MSEYLIANYHTHTTRCKHAWGTEREYIEAAIRAGIKTLGFADHAPIPYENGYVSGIRMKIEEAAEYVETLRTLQKEYEGRIRILIGFEAEYLPEYFSKQMKIYDALGIDYLIMGQHFLDSEQDGPYASAATEDESFLAAYVDRVIEGMKTGRFLYLAHPDLINYRGEDAIYTREITRLCEQMKALDIPVEINLLGLQEGKHYPRERFWEIAGSVGVPVVFGIDAHWVEQIGNMDCYQKAMTLVERYHLNLFKKLDI